MTYLLDTNVVSELRRTRPHVGVVAWLGGVPPDLIAIAAATIGELQTGIEKARLHDPGKAVEIEDRLEQILGTMRVLPMDATCFRRWAILMHRRSGSMGADAMIAATALVHRLTVDTRNTKDFVDFGLALLDPFAPR